MSGAEGLIAVGIASSFVQLIDFTASLCSRIREYASGVSLPKKLAAQADRLSDLLAVLDSLATTSGHSPLDEQLSSRCLAKAQELSDLLDSFKGQGQGPLKNARKAFKSLSRSEQIVELQEELDGLVNTLSLHLQFDTRSTTKQIEVKTISILERQMEQTSILNNIRYLAATKGQTSEQSDVLYKVFWIVPIGRNPGFVGRSALMSTLESKLVPMPHSVSTAVLCGLGGVGKSQIALEYAYRLREQSSNLSVFWVHAGNTARYVESYKRIASECNIAGKDDPNLDVLQLVRDWLETKYQCRWLMIFDNVDDRTMFFDSFSPSGKTLREYVPQSMNGAIIYTTRNRDIGIDLSLDRDPIIVSSMELEDARSLLGDRIRADSTDEEQLELLDALVYLPLAVSQAVAFMAKRNIRVSDYMEMYHQSESTRIRLLGQRFSHHGREARPLESVVTTWWISFNHIKSDNPRAAELLSVMSFMDYQNVPFSLLVRHDEEDFDFHEAMGLLEAFSLITLNTHRSACNIHRLVTVAVQAWLTEFENKRDNLAKYALEIVADRFPDGFFQSWATCRIYIPHAEAVLRSTMSKSRDSALHARASLLLRMSTYLRMQGQYEASQRDAEVSMQLFEELYGRNHEDTLTSIANYAYTIHKRGQYRQATDLQREVLLAREKLLGYGNRATLESLNALGSDLQTLGLYNEAEDIHRRELSEKQKLLDCNPSDQGLEADALIALENLGRVLSSQGRYAEAEALHRQGLEKSKSIRGYRHPDTFITRGDLAATVRDQGRLAEAEQMYEELLEDRLEMLGRRHPATLTTLSNMATVKAGLDKNKEAEKLYTEVLKVELETFGEQHPSTVNSIHNLACCAYNKKDYQEAEKGFRTCLEAQKLTVGPRHPDTMRTRRNLSATLKKQEKYGEAEGLDRQTLAVCDSLPENKDAERLETLNSLAETLAEQGKFDEAECFTRKELEIRLAVAGVGHPSTVLCSNRLAFVFASQKKNKEAIGLYKEILAYRVTVHGWENPETRATLWNLALGYRDLEQFELAEAKYQQLVDIQSELLGPEHTETLESLFQLSWVLQQQRKYAASEERYRRLLKAQSAALGLEDPTTLTIMNNLGSVLKYQDDCSEEALTLQRYVYETRSRLLGPTHELSQKALWFLAVHLHDQGKNDEAEAYFKIYDHLLETAASSTAELAAATSD